ncbi:MAG: glucose PTS transporter subunit IIA [Cellulosilyticaceae bacterium]
MGYEILKIYNNNVVLAKQENQTVILISKGIGFGKKMGRLYPSEFALFGLLPADAGVPTNWFYVIIVEAIFGGRSYNIKNQINDIIGGNTSAYEQGAKEEQNSVKESLKVVKEEEIYIPITGRLMPITEVPDEVFSQKMMGDGFAIEPVNGEVYSPVSGEVVNVFPTKHAIGIISEGGREVLIHFGMDTVNLKGEGLRTHIKEGDKVKAGDRILTVDIGAIRGKAPSLITPIVFTDLPEGQMIEINKGHVNAKDKNKIKIISK